MKTRKVWQFWFRMVGLAVVVGLAALLAREFVGDEDWDIYSGPTDVSGYLLTLRLRGEAQGEALTLAQNGKATVELNDTDYSPHHWGMVVAVGGTKVPYYFAVWHDSNDWAHVIPVAVRK